MGLSSVDIADGSKNLANQLRSSGYLCLPQLSPQVFVGFLWFIHQYKIETTVSTGELAVPQIGCGVASLQSWVGAQRRAARMFR